MANFLNWEVGISAEIAFVDEISATESHKYRRITRARSVLSIPSVSQNHIRSSQKMHIVPDSLPRTVT